LPPATETDTLRIMWTSFGTSEDGPGEEFYRRMSAPENEIPVAVALNTVLARTDDVAVALQRLSVYTTGVSFDLVVRLRPDTAGARGRDLNELFWGHAPGAEQGRFLMGVELADGRRASNLSGRHGPVPGDEIVFTQGGGSGGLASVEQSWWLYPLPPEGPLRFVVRCPELGVDERSVVLDGSAIQAAARDVVVLWPWAPPPESGPSEPPPPPDLPDDSWFAQSD
jgi:hypothetical protein